MTVSRLILKFDSDSIRVNDAAFMVKKAPIAKKRVAPASVQNTIFG
jgi:hypothetical protein